MSTVLLKPQTQIRSWSVEAGLLHNLYRIIQEWAQARSCIRMHWNRYYRNSDSHSIPYRVWRRHGAYLQMDKANRW